jgi:YHS domain-containing protein
MKLIAVLALVLFAACAGNPEPRRRADQPNPYDPSVHRMKDPVCGMMCDAKYAKTAEHEGKTYYFCSDECKAKFQSAPESYVARR